MSVEPILEARALVAGYSDVPILRGVGMDLGRGEIVAIIGPNGAGKSTLIKAMFGLLRIQGGSVHMDGEDITGRSPQEIVSLGMSYVPQVSNTFPSLTVRENLEMGAYLLNYGPSGIVGGVAAQVVQVLQVRVLRRPTRRFYSAKRVPAAVVRERIERVLTLFPTLRERLSTRVGNLSGGQQQMVAFARALMLEPKVLLIDEPSAGLAPNLVDATFRRIEEINRTGTSIVLVEQNARRALRIANRGYVLEAGQNRYADDARLLLENPEVGRLYLGGGAAEKGKEGAVRAPE